MAPKVYPSTCAPPSVYCLDTPRGLSYLLRRNSWRSYLLYRRIRRSIHLLLGHGVEVYPCVRTWHGFYSTGRAWRGVGFDGVRGGGGAFGWKGFGSAIVGEFGADGAGDARSILVSSGYAVATRGRLGQAGRCKARPSRAAAVAATGRKVLGNFPRRRAGWMAGCYLQ